MSINDASVCHIESQTTTTSMATANRWNGFQCDTIKIEVMQELNGGVFAMLSFPVFVLKCYIWPYISLSIHAIYPYPFHSLVPSIFPSHFSSSFFLSPFCLLFKCKLQLHTICIENRKFTQQTVCVHGGVSEWVSLSIFLVFLALSLHLKSENFLRIQRQSRTDFHYRRILIVIQKCTHLYWAWFFFSLVPWCATCSLAFLSF